MAVDIPSAVMDMLTGSRRRRSSMSLRARILLLCFIWIVALFPFVLLSRTTWFGRPLSDQQIGEYLHADEKPKQIEYALGQIRQRMSRHDASVSIWYPDLVRLSTHRFVEVRAMDALVIGEDAVLPDLHNALLAQLFDSSPAVRFNAATSLARAGDTSGHSEIVTVLALPDATPEQITQGLAALSSIGTEQDLTLISRYEPIRIEIPERIRQQALATKDAIRARTGH